MYTAFLEVDDIAAVHGTNEWSGVSASPVPQRSVASPGLTRLTSRTRVARALELEDSAVL